LTVVLTLATLAGFAAVVLSLFAVLVPGLGVEAYHTAKEEARNRSLTNAQARAQRLIESWQNVDSGSKFDEKFVSEGRLRASASGFGHTVESHDLLV
jgi:hypothetical protein